MQIQTGQWMDWLVEYAQCQIKFSYVLQLIKNHFIEDEEIKPNRAAWTTISVLEEAENKLETSKKKTNCATTHLAQGIEKKKNFKIVFILMVSVSVWATDH